MKTQCSEIAPGVYRLSMAPTEHFEFNQFLIVDKKTCLVHAGKAMFFADLKKMVKDTLAKKKLDYIVFSHCEADETGALNHWLQEFPKATVVANKIANINLEDHLIRPAKILKDADVLDLGSKKMQMIETPHFPHNWDAHLWFEKSEKILFSSDFCCQGEICEPVVETDISTHIIDFYERGKFLAYGLSCNNALIKLANLNFKTIAPMHGSTLKGKIVSQVFQTIKEDLNRRI